MDIYSLLREIADSWGLLALFTYFVGMAVYVFRPGSRALHDDAAQVPFRDDTAPSLSCTNACPDCTFAGTAPDLGRRSA